MDLLGTLVKTGIKLRSRRQKKQSSPLEEQMKVLQKLLVKAENTQFGKHYHFGMMVGLRKAGDPKAKYKQFCRNVPTHTYNQIFDAWWNKTLKGQPDVCWPGQTKYFALSSGTSEAATKHIPITRDIIKSNQKTSIRQILTLSHYKDLPSDFFIKGILMLGGSTNLNFNGISYEGDLSGIQVSQIPFWFQPFYKPGAKIAQEKDWGKKLDEIVLKAKDWDIGCVAGVPAWIQILIEKIIRHYKVKTIHEIWPNFSVYGHGGVSFEPYRKAFDKLMGRPLIYLETYLASEGFIAYQARPETRGMKLAIDNGIFFEFVPFNEENFNSEGDMVANPQTLLIDEVEEGKDYAILISTCAGAWRYLIGDVIRFSDLEKCEIMITGRTKHYISLCGEHMSVENMNSAIAAVQEQFNVAITEFAVAGIRSGTLFGHKWFVSCDDVIDSQKLIEAIDQQLKNLNDDYSTERGHGLKELQIEVVPLSYFHRYLEKKGKLGGQNKFPRVLKKHQMEEFEELIRSLKSGG
ncbi:MAG TPA: GH3 auxin-responsive promoter family protein [Catalimonadaceae bacterium]|nr:GH3 auxin-responsive promoter family protein [Catalimonadaceae bacterium]HPI11381.1 GH3 auxin-responsive promoter family protein [Catalimonadaceae bacterium]